MKVGKGLHLLLMKFTNREFIKFIIAGIINTVLSYLLYLILLLYLTYQISYVVSFILGILISYYINSKFVFNEQLSIKKLLSFPVVYVVQLLLNYLFLYVFIEILSISSKLAPLLVTIISLPVTFLLSRFVLKGNKNNRRKL